jgi:hypothetical protein
MAPGASSTNTIPSPQSSCAAPVAFVGARFFSLSLEGSTSLLLCASDLCDPCVNNVAVVIGAYHEKGADAGKPYDYHDRMLRRNSSI